MQSYIATIQAFVASLMTLLKHPSTPAHARKWFQEATDEVANHHGREDGETLADALLRALSRGVEDEGELDSRACRELGQAFATLERYRDYIPGKLYGDFADSMQEVVNLAQWETRPELVEQIMPLVIRQALKNVDAQQKVSR